ncbi:MAG: hypothetical protein P0Y59_11965 [Candidatus Sphingomonas phytovorans]|nr:hypothetical protein [Sphingomonas sp.]WEK02360.1 MAG: hypothetical protein P0Y59_11965 [Sphingomonas sp.]
MVLQLDGTGPCGGSLFHIQRTAVNFHELTSLMYTAASLKKTVNLYVSSCNGNRNIIEVGDVSF